MTITLVLVLVGLLALAGLLVLARVRAGSTTNMESLTEQLCSVDVDAFRNLVDPGEEQYLRANLPESEFRKIQRERILAAIEYVSCAARNGSILMRVGDAARHSPDPSMAEAGEKLINTAIRLRLYSLRAMATLYLGLILPGVRISPAGIAESYEQMTRLVVLLGCFQHAPQGVAAAL
jgi:hypothetical protein